VDVSAAADALGPDYAWLYPRKDQVCFLDGHVRAFAHFGGVPQRLLYDNLKPAVARVLVGSSMRAPVCQMPARSLFSPPEGASRRPLQLTDQVLSDLCVERTGA
jgi:transposase